MHNQLPLERLVKPAIWVLIGYALLELYKPIGARLPYHKSVDWFIWPPSESTAPDTWYYLKSILTKLKGLSWAISYFLFAKQVNKVFGWMLFIIVLYHIFDIYLYIACASRYGYDALNVFTGMLFLIVLLKNINGTRNGQIN